MPLFCNTLSNDKNMTKVSHLCLSLRLCCYSMASTTTTVQEKSKCIAFQEFISFFSSIVQHTHDNTHVKQRAVKLKMACSVQHMFSQNHKWISTVYSLKLLTLILWLWKRGLWNYGEVTLNICTRSLSESLFCIVLLLY